MGEKNKNDLGLLSKRASKLNTNQQNVFLKLEKCKHYVVTMNLLNYIKLFL